MDKTISEQTNTIKALKAMLQSQMNENDNLHKTIETIESILNNNSISDKQKVKETINFLNS